MLNGVDADTLGKVPLVHCICDGIGDRNNTSCSGNNYPSCTAKNTLSHDGDCQHRQRNIGSMMELGLFGPGVKFCVSVFRQKSRMALESRADSGLNPLVTESHGGQNGMRAGTA